MKKQTKTKIYKLAGVGVIITLLAIGLVFLVIQTERMMTNAIYNWAYKHCETTPITYSAPVKEEQLTNEQVLEKIKFYSGVFQMDSEKAIKVAKCESGLNPKAENIEGSATGLYQFIRKTWKANCKGNVYNADANIICFMQHFKDNPGAWSASKSCWE